MKIKYASEGSKNRVSVKSVLVVLVTSLNRFLLTQRNAIECQLERLISGAGLSSIHDFLCRKWPEKVSKVIQTELDGTPADGKPGIVAKFSSSDELCSQVYCA